MTALRLDDEHFRLLVESVEDYAIVLLDPDGVICSWNAGAERITGFRGEQVIGAHFSKLYRSDDPSWTSVLARAKESGRAQEDGWRLRADGSQFWASVVVTALNDRRGSPIGFAKITRDLTDRGYRAFVEATHAIVWTTDASGRANADSPSWRAFTGQTEEEWRGGRGWDPVHPDDVDAVARAWTRSKETGDSLEIEFRLRRHDGQYVWMASRAIPFRDSDGHIREWFGVSFDISQRKAAEHELERARSSLETTLRSIGDGVIATDARGFVTFVNAVAEHITGWSSADAIGRPLGEVFVIVDELTRATLDSPVDRVLRENGIVELTNHTVLIRRDGSEVAIDDSAAPIRGRDGALEGVVLVFRDKSREKLLIARREFLARAGQELTGASDYRDALSKIAQLAVPRLADWCAIDVVDPAHETPRRLAVAHADPAKVAFALELQRRYPPDPNAPTGVPNVLRTGRSELYLDIPPEMLDRLARDEEHRRILGELDLRSGMIVALRGRDRVFGAITFVLTGSRRYSEDDLAFAEDFAQRCAMLVERRKLEEEAAQASHAKDQFLAMLGHELRNPLAPIRTALEVMELVGDRSTERERKVIERQVEHLVRLVDDLLDVSRITRGKVALARERIEMSAVIDRAIEIAGPLLEARGHHIEIDVPREGRCVLADPARLAQVFGNLLTNAAKFTDPGGHIVVRATVEGDDVVTSVIDDGIGIERAMLPSIFEMFVQEPQSSARSHGGLGLGLSIARSLVTMHGGTLSAHSEGVGRGATFTVRMPASAEGTRASAPPPLRSAGEHTGPARRVLLVDDNADALALTKLALERLGYELAVAYDGPSALELTKTFVPEVAVLDIGLPVMDGYELAHRLRDRFSALPLIALTGYGQEHDRQRTREAGFASHLVKPVSLPELRAAIEALLASHHDSES